MSETKRGLCGVRWAALGVVAAISAGGLAFVACSSDSSTGGGGGTDAAGDGAGDDSAVDSTTTPPDTGADTGAGSDGRADSTTGDAAPDSGSSDGATGDADAGAQSDADGGSCTVFDASGLDEAAVQAGFLEVWHLYKCQNCHQNSNQTVDEAGVGIVLSGNNNGLPNGDAAPTAYPPNLTNDPTTGLGCWTNDQIQNAILNGVDDQGRMLCPKMPLWGHINRGPDSGTPMDAGTAQEIIAFLRSLPPVVNQVPDTTCAVAEAGTDADAGAIVDASADGD